MFRRLLWRVAAGYLLLLATTLAIFAVATPFAIDEVGWALPMAGYGLIAATLLAYGTTALVTQVTTRRLESLIVTARRIASGELGRTADVPGDDEIAVLAQALNAMADQLRRRIRAAEIERERL